MVNFVQKNLYLNKAEKVSFIAIFSTLALFFAVANIYWIAGKLGIYLAANWYRDIVDAVTTGTTLGTAMFWFLGVTVPGWLLVAASAFALASA